MALGICALGSTSLKVNTHWKPLPPNTAMNPASSLKRVALLMAPLQGAADRRPIFS